MWPSSTDARLWTTTGDDDDDDENDNDYDDDNDDNDNYRLTNNGDGCIKCPVGTTPSQDGFRCEGGENYYLLDIFII